MRVPVHVHVCVLCVCLCMCCACMCLRARESACVRVSAARGCESDRVRRASVRVHRCAFVFVFVYLCVRVRACVCVCTCVRVRVRVRARACMSVRKFCMRSSVSCLSLCDSVRLPASLRGTYHAPSCLAAPMINRASRSALATSQINSNVTSTVLMSAAGASAACAGLGCDGNRYPPRRRRLSALLCRQDGIARTHARSWASDTVEEGTGVRMTDATMASCSSRLPRPGVADFALAIVRQGGAKGKLRQPAATAARSSAMANE